MRSGLLDGKVGLKSGYVLVESGFAGGSQAADRLRIVVVELFVYLDVTGFTELVDLNTEIAGSGICFFPDECEFRFLLLHEQADHGKPELGM